MSRKIELYIQDILESIDAIEEYTKYIDYNFFEKDRKTYSATIREFTIIGEAISKIIDILIEKEPSYPWRLIKDFRNLIVHEYFGVDSEIVWDLVKNELPILKEIIKKIDESSSF